jgi:hypothetical protein
MRWVVVAAVFAGATPGQAYAEAFGFQSGEQLLANCESSKPQDATGCRNYISGAVDTMQLAQRLTLACMFIPKDDFTQEQAIDVVVQYLKAHPDELWMSGARNVIAAMASEYPCPK